MMSENYSEPEELLSDESFLDWYFKIQSLYPSGSGSGTGSFDHAVGGGHWETWIAAAPQRRELVEQAIRLLETTRIPEKEIPAHQRLAAEDALMQKIHPPRAQIYRQLRYSAAAAAVLLILTTAGWLINRSFSGQSRSKTGFGQVSEVQLPDGTEVMLNANSKLTWSIGTRDGDDREAWLDGEAFFHVRKTPSKSRFVVHTEHFDIQVMGTQFNVVNRKNRNNVMLQEGAVILHAGMGDLKMVPGDFVEFHGGQLERRAIKDDSLLAWKDHRLIFENTPLRSLARIIAEQYGVEVRLEDQPTGDKTISAILPNNNLDVLLKALQLTEQFDVARKDGYILIRSRSSRN